MRGWCEEGGRTPEFADETLELGDAIPEACDLVEGGVVSVGR